MSSVLFWPSILVAVLFLAAAALKLLQPRLFLSQLKGYNLLPPRLVAPAAATLVGLEVLGAIMTIVPDYHRLGCYLLLALLGVFTAAVIRALSGDNRQISCACFGRARKDLDWSIPVRNAFLASALALGTLSEASELTLASVATTTLAACAVFLVVEAMALSETITGGA